MILDAILGFICAIPHSILNSISSIGTLVIPEGTFEWWKNIFSTLTYVFPVWSLVPIFLFSIAIKGFEIIMALFHRIKGLFWASN